MSSDHGIWRQLVDALMPVPPAVRLILLACAIMCALGIYIICDPRYMSFQAAAAEVPRFQGLKTAAIWKIPVVVYGSEKELGCTNCVICLSEFLDGEYIRVLPKCHHCYHVPCVDKWLASNSSCPTCRRPVAEDEAGHGGDVVVEIAGRE